MDNKRIILIRSNGSFKITLESEILEGHSLLDPQYCSFITNNSLTNRNISWRNFYLRHFSVILFLAIKIQDVVTQVF